MRVVNLTREELHRHGDSMPFESMDLPRTDFIEVLPKEEDSLIESSSPYVEALVITVEPQECSALVQWLTQALPLSNTSSAASQRVVWDLSHLKRVQRRVSSSSSSSPTASSTVDSASTNATTGPIVATRKRARITPGDTKEDSIQSSSSPSIITTLKVLIGAKDMLEEQFGSEEDDGFAALRQKIALQLPSTRDVVRLETVSVPKRPPQSAIEYQEFNAIWPTLYLPHQMAEYRAQQLQLDDTERCVMRRGLEAAIDDATVSPLGGVVIACPTTGRVIAAASEEYRAQQGKLDSLWRRNPLVTPYILAIQGVSRIERTTWGTESPSSQYLCTGYDVYGVLEPTVYEAMALVHSRVRRLVFGLPLTKKESGIVEAQVHALPGTNHHFRAFMCLHSSDLWERCKAVDETKQGPPINDGLSEHQPI